jgi:hypothetical protein
MSTLFNKIVTYSKTQIFLSAEDTLNRDGEYDIVYQKMRGHKKL